MTYTTTGVCDLCGQTIYRFDGIDGKTWEDAAAEAATIAAILHVVAHGRGTSPSVIRNSWDKESQEDVAQRVQQERAYALKLFEAMSGWCNAHHNVPWWEKAPIALWRRAMGRPVYAASSDDDPTPHDVDDGRADTPQEEIAVMLDLARKARGWWVVIAEGEPMFVPMATWELLYNAQEAT